MLAVVTTISAVGVIWCNVTNITLREVTPTEWSSASPEDIACIPDTACVALQEEDIKLLQPTSCSGFRGCFSYSIPEAMAGMGFECFASLAEVALFFVSAPQIAFIPPSSFHNIPAKVIHYIPNESCKGISSSQFDYIMRNPISCSGLKTGCVNWMTTNIVPQITAGCISRVSKDFFYDINPSAFQAIPVDSLELTVEKMGYMSSNCGLLSLAHVKKFQSSGICGGFSPVCIAQMSSELFSVIEEECLRNLTSLALSKISPRQVVRIRPAVLTSGISNRVRIISYATCQALTVPQMALIRSNHMECNLSCVTCNAAINASVRRRIPEGAESAPASMFTFTFALVLILILYALRLSRKPTVQRSEEQLPLLAGKIKATAALIR